MMKRSARRAIVGLAVAVLVGAVAACDDDGSGGGGITIQSSDSTPPELSLKVALAGGTEEATVEPGGPGQTLTLPNRTGTLNLAATAKDEQTGVQRVQIWMETTVTTCDAAGVCSGGNPTLPGQPLFESTEPTKSPGDTTSASSIELEALALPDAIKGTAPPGGTLTVKLGFFAVALNHLGQRAQTAKVSAVWAE